MRWLLVAMVLLMGCQEKTGPAGPSASSAAIGSADATLSVAGTTLPVKTTLVHDAGDGTHQLFVSTGALSCEQAPSIASLEAHRESGIRMAEGKKPEPQALHFRAQVVPDSAKGKRIQKVHFAYHGGNGSSGISAGQSDLAAKDALSSFKPNAPFAIDLTLERNALKGTLKPTLCTSDKPPAWKK